MELVFVWNIVSKLIFKWNSCSFLFFPLFFCTLKSVNQLHRNSLTIHNMLIACDNRYIWIFRVCLSESHNIMWICSISIWSTTTCHQLDAGFYRWNFSKTKIDKTHAKAIVSRDVTNTISLFFFAVFTLSRSISLLSFHEIEECAVFLCQQMIRGHWRIMFVLHQIQNALWLWIFIPHYIVCIST